MATFTMFVLWRTVSSRSTADGKLTSVMRARRCVAVIPTPPWASHDSGTFNATQVLVDQNKEAMAHPYICINLLKVSSDNRMLAFTMDTTGDDSFSVHIKDLTTGARLKVPGSRPAFACTQVVLLNPFFVFVVRATSSPTWSVLNGPPMARLSFILYLTI
jgi:protease II